MKESISDTFIKYQERRDITMNERKLQTILSMEKSEFIKNVYHALLKREADKDGFNTYLNALENGMYRERMIFEIRMSAEGIAQNQAISGLKIPEIEISRLLELDGDNFVEGAYIAILGRSSDQNGKLYYVDRLKSGAISKEEIIYSIRKSEEGQNIGIQVLGLNKAYIVRKVKKMILQIPFIGRIIRVVKNKHRTNGEVNAILGHVEVQTGDLSNRIDRIQNSTQDFDKRLNEVQQEVEKLEMELIAERIKNQIINKVTTGTTYKSFEDEMRGSREEIKQRLKIYSNVIDNVKKHNGNRIFALDLGCGRGEWLELLKEEFDIDAMGVDLDESMLEACDRRGLNVVKCDLLTYLKNAHSNSVDIITMFQVVEHLPVNILLEALNECSRVLRNGGVCILETPNPENMIVGVCNFYFDPTHIRKFPPTLLKVLVESSELHNVEILKLHPYNAIDINGVESNTKEGLVIKEIAEFFNTYADYAVIAYK